MKSINYSKIFTQKLRENNVFGLFCEESSDELLCLLFNKKDFFINFMVSNPEKNAITEVIQALKKQGLDIASNIEKAYMDTKLIYDTLEL